MGKKNIVEPIQDTQNQTVTPERKRGASTKPKEAKKPVVKASSAKEAAPVKAKATVATPEESSTITTKMKPVVKKVTPKPAKSNKLESIKQKAKNLKKQWLIAMEKVDELKKAFKKLKKKEGKAQAKMALGANLKTAKIERKSLKKAYKVAKKTTKKAA